MCIRDRVRRTRKESEEKKLDALAPSFSHDNHAVFLMRSPVASRGPESLEHLIVNHLSEGQRAAALQSLRRLLAQLPQGLMLDLDLSSKAVLDSFYKALSFDSGAFEGSGNPKISKEHSSLVEFLRSKKAAATKFYSADGERMPEDVESGPGESGHPCEKIEWLNTATPRKKFFGVLKSAYDV
eukprot:TRINITY_DN12157_c0_g2_i1.p1 TRINITY_DN12157_c0_g2~~TRINITY_DN12157_c0_g2_i1.p1  ORF type:complete len:193 (+),score=49.96 TRINITY_DN12157_c0_g2_i1:31-579(+)